MGVSPTPYSLRVPEDIAQFLRSLHPALKAKMKAAVDAIRSQPEAGKALREELAGLRSFRVGRHRIVYRVVEPRCVELVAVGPRKTIYAETFRLLTKKVRPVGARQ